MAIYSFNHDSFGLTTHGAGAAAANVRYNSDLSKTQMDKLLDANARHLDEYGVHRSDSEIAAHLDTLRQGRSAAENAAYNAREEACYAVRSHVIPPGPNEAEAWFRSQEQGERKNARMSDRFIAALPRELTPDQCLEAVEKFCRDITQNRIPWHFALHLELDQRDKPDWNPHAHIIFRDRDIETNRRFLYTSAAPQERARLLAKGVKFWTTAAFREKWSAEMNLALERAGHDVRVDHRSLKDQGIDRDPQIHVGPASKNAERKGYPFRSKDRQVADRTIPYTILDGGSRSEHNATIVERGRCPLPPDPHSSRHPDQEKLRDAQGKVRQAMYREQKLDRDALREAHQARFAEHRQWAKQLYADARKAAFAEVREMVAEKWAAVRAIHDPVERNHAADILKLEQKELYAKVSGLHIDQARLEKDQAWQTLRKGQFDERAELRAAHRDEYASLSRQQAAERLGVGERRRAKDLQHDANRLAARFSGPQGMTAQQGAAQQAIRLADRASRDSADINPALVALSIMKVVAAEYDHRHDIRTRLNAQREANHLRAAAPGHFRGQAAAMQALGRVMDGDQPQLAAASGASSGRLPGSGRNATPQDVPDRLDQRDRAAGTDSFHAPRQTPNRGRGREGGGRGR